MVQFPKTGTKVFGKCEGTVHIHLELVLGCPLLFGAVFWCCIGLGGLDLGCWYLGGWYLGGPRGLVPRMLGGLGLGGHAKLCRCGEIDKAGVASQGVEKPRGGKQEGEVEAQAISHAC